MNDKTPELLPELRMLFDNYLGALDGGQKQAVAKAALETALWDNKAGIVAALTRPTPAERPVPQVREALIEYVSTLRQHQIDPETRDELLNFIMAHVSTARPSDAAVAKPLPGELALIQIAMETLRHIANYTPVSRIQPVMIARDALKKIDALTFESEPVKALALPPDEPARVTDKGK